MKKEKKIKVAFCIPTMVIGGCETIFVNTIDELSKKSELDITIVTHAKIKEPLYCDWLKKHKNISVYVYYPLHNFFEDMDKYCQIFPLKNIRKICFSLYKKYRRLLAYTKGVFQDIDVICDYKNLSFYKELKYFNKPKITWLHSAFSYFQSIGTFSRLPQYTKIIGITDDAVNEFKKVFPQYSDRIVRIYNPINVDYIRNKALSEQSPNEKYFCHVSRLVKGKDIKTLLNAFELFYTKHKDVKLYIIGDGHLSDELKAYAGTLKSNKNIVFTGSINNPYGFMRGAIANILSSEFEGLPTVVLESVALGVPCISSNCNNGPHEILLDGKAGLLFDIGDVSKLYEHMLNVYSGNIDKENMIKNMKKSISRFNASEIATQITETICDTYKGS